MKKKGKIRRKKKENKQLTIFFIILISLLIVVVLSSILFIGKSELTQGEPASEFCIGECGENNYYTSYNNTKYGFVRCDCVVGIKFSHSEKFGASDYPQVNVSYFDLITLNEISIEEVVERIENGE